MKRREEDAAHGCLGPAYGIWLVMFLVLKFGGNVTLMTWSWWWVLLPIVPVLVVVFTQFGFLP